MRLQKYRTEYRINKKGRECYRSEFCEEAQARLEELSKNRPGVFTMQTRCAPIDSHGVVMQDLAGNILWSQWR